MNWRKLRCKDYQEEIFFKHSSALSILSIGITCYQENILQNQSMALVRLQDAKTSFMYVTTEAKSF